MPVDDVSISRFGQPVSKLALEQQIQFYERFAHELTIAIRSIWSDATISDQEKVDQMKWINEIMHRIPNKLSQLRNPTYEWTNESFEAMVQHWVKQNPAICKNVNHAINGSYKIVLRMYEQPE